METLQLWQEWTLKSVQLFHKNKALNFEALDWASTQTGNLVEFAFSFKEKLKVERLEITLQATIKLGQAVINGFQSWSECQVADENAVQKNLLLLAKPLMAKSGDYTFYNYKNKKNVLHSWHYLQFLPFEENEAYFLGALSPQKGYTCFEWNTAQEQLTIVQFCEQKFEAKEKYTFTIFGKKAPQNTSFDEYFAQFPAKTSFENKRKFTGWTSWYLHYTNINEGIISSNLNNFVASKTPINYFQIDDGWQISVGDWRCNSKFPNGFKSIVDVAKQNNIKPGLWLAPFIVEKDSFIFREKKHWLLKNKLGKPIKMTYNPLWSGWFYALDFYNNEVRDYIAETLQRVTKEWGFSLLKLDFLYAVGIVPQHNKSRGQVMWEAMVWLREQLKEVEILACGVPLNSAFGNSDFCRIGPDVSESWDVNWLKMAHHAERLSTKNAIRNSILRFPLDYRAFRNDPDVFILREKNQYLTPNQQFTLFVINQLFGNLIFTSDDISTYSESKKNLYNQQFPAQNIEIIDATISHNLLVVHAKTPYANLKIFSNLLDKKQSVDTLNEDFLIANDLSLQFPKFFTLEAFKTQIFTLINPQNKWQLAASNRHVFAGNDLNFLSPNSSQSIEISKHQQATAGTVTFFSQQKSLNINNKTYTGKAMENEAGFLVVFDDR